MKQLSPEKELCDLGSFGLEKNKWKDGHTGYKLNNWLSAKQIRYFSSNNLHC